MLSDIDDPTTRGDWRAASLVSETGPGELDDIAPGDFYHCRSKERPMTAELGPHSLPRTLSPRAHHEAHQSGSLDPTIEG